jgi:peptide-methionine (S)-S-oxide reductase
VFYADESQKATAESLKEKIDQSGLWEDPIVTIIEPLRNYYIAEDYHQNYFNQNPDQGYCSVVIAPKVSKIRKAYASLLKE